MQAGLISVFLFYISLGKVAGGTAPILDGNPGTLYSNPLPHVLILTAIVVGVATTALGLALILRISEAFGSIEEDEIIESISFSKPTKANYVKFPNPASRYAMVGVFVAQFGDEVRVAVTGAGEGGVFRHQEMESVLSSNFSADSLSSVNIDSDGLISDLHASAEYRANLIKEMTKRAVV